MSKLDENTIVIIWRDETKNLRPWFKWTFGLVWAIIVGIASVVLAPILMALWPIMKLEKIISKPIKRFCKWAFYKKEAAHE